ncbi:MAG: hypothetical protein HGGPFJEG_02327 [Ignavibacteria bacterium]|nr:hypothetical protein [Ignavibacteria bacterium]
MKAVFSLETKNFNVDLSKPHPLSIQLDFFGDQPNSYNVENASAKTYETSGFIGDTRKGGGCNFEVYKIIPHCNGTHTECVGHISFERIFINNVLTSVIFPCTLISVIPEHASVTQDIYVPGKNADDFLITEKILREKLINTNENFLEALIIRTMPNDVSKISRQYMNTPTPFFSLNAMNYISEKNVKHLLIDLPSVDRTFDEGKLSAHHIFWNVKPESHDVDKYEHSLNTITEMVYVPDYIKDGIYFINIQIPDFKSDAAPSRVFLYDIIQSED